MNDDLNNFPGTRAEKMIYQELLEIKKLFLLKRRMFEGLLINDIVKDLRVSADYVISEWIQTGLLKAVKLPGERNRGGYRIGMDDYLQFLSEIKFSPEEEKIIFLETPEQIIKRFHEKRELLKQKKR